jgi:hypothetical protein
LNAPGENPAGKTGVGIVGVFASEVAVSRLVGLREVLDAASLTASLPQKRVRSWPALLSDPVSPILTNVSSSSRRSSALHSLDVS